ncbi:MAG: GatB/YqeY domain-containing protein [Proteobacteria bacterium]|nr:GatB/YqeY domain-containing protein [Pseudomonadota bacterium]
MPIVNEISAQLKTAMRARDAARTAALRGIRAAFLTAEKADGAGEALTDEAAMTILRRLAKQRGESIEAYDQGGRDELAAAERAELAVIQEFLPQLADEAQTRAWVEEAIAKTGASAMRDMGKVMGMLMGAHKAELDGKLTNVIVRELLS